jgi:nucleoside-diphosphate-sugar epimerase
MIVYTEAEAEVTIRAFSGVRQLIHCSTGATYGFPLPLPVTEEVPCRAEQQYGRQKREADARFLRAYHSDGFPVTIIKPNITYGHRWTHRLPSQLTWNWLRRVVDGKPIVVVGDGDQIHHFQHADDSASGFAGSVGNDRTIGQVFNNCGTQACTWREFHQTVMRIIGRSVPIVGIPRADLLALRDRHPAIEERNFWYHMDVSNAKLRRVVPAYHQQHSLESGLRDILAEFDPEKVQPNPPEVDEMLDDLVARQGRVIA